MYVSICRNIIYCLVIIFIIASPNCVFSQTDELATPNLDVTGAVKKAGKRLENATVTVYKNSKQVDQFTTSKDGVFELKLDYNSSYILEFAKAGHVSKKMEFTTSTPPEKIAEGFDPFEFEISLFDNNPKLNTDILKQAVAKVFYDSEQAYFDFDQAYSNQIADQMAELEEQLLAIQEEEDLAKQKADAEALAKQKADAAAQKIAEEAKKKAEIEAKKQAEADALAKKKAEEEATRKAAEDAKKKAEADALATKQAEDTAAKKIAEEEATRKAAEEAKKKAEANALAKIQAEADALVKKKAEVEAARKQAEEAKKKAEADALAKQKIDEEAQKQVAAKALFQQQQAIQQSTTNQQPETNTIQQEIDKAVKLSDEERSREFLSELAQKYPEGVTVESFQEANRVITRVIVNRNNIANEFKKVKYNWGGLYFFKNNTSITQGLFDQETKQ
jgi:hypothetical protein